MSEYRRALEQIATGEMPCIDCGVAHRYRPNERWIAGKMMPARVAGTWASPEDGHTYRRMAAVALAASVLEGERAHPLERP